MCDEDTFVGSKGPRDYTCIVEMDGCVGALPMKNVSRWCKREVFVETSIQSKRKLFLNGHGKWLSGGNVQW